MKSPKHLLVRMPLARAVALWAEHLGVEPPARATATRWIHDGIDGVRLRAERFGRRWFCRPADVLAFHGALNSKRLQGHRREGEEVL
jgi:hypothetical protein